jgi:WD40 repeat protein
VVPAAIPEVAPRAPVAPPVAALAFRPDGALLAAGGFRQVLIVDPATGLIEPPLGGPAGIVRALAFSPDGRLLAAGGGDPAQSGEAQLWDLAGPSVVKALETRTDAVYSVAFGPDGRVLATSSYDRTIKLWAVPGGREIATLREHTGPVYAAAFSPDGRHLVSASGDATAKIWEVPSGRRVATLSGAVGELYTAVFRPGGREIAVGGEDGWLRIWTWDGTHAELRRALRAHRGGVARCAYSGDGAILVSAGSDNVVKSWSSETLAELRATGPWPHPVAALAVSPDGRTIALGGTDGAIVVLEAATGRQLFATRSPAKRTW